MKVLNFSTDLFHEHLLCRSKNCTVRLGDKTSNYHEGDLVLVTQGEPFKPRTRLYQAVIDNIEILKLKELTPELVQSDHPSFSSTADIAAYLNKLHGRNVGSEDLVTIIYFSEILE